MVMKKDYDSVTADRALENDVRALVRLSIAEDLRDSVDWTTVCLVDADRRGGCRVVPRKAGLCAGLATLHWIVDEFDADLECEIHAQDGDALVAGNAIASIRGNARDLLTAERTILNILCRTCGVATLTRRYVDQIEGSRSRLYDTRKTTPGWRLLEKYSVRCGGGHNHRTGLYDGFLIKDNHLALAGNDGVPMPAGMAAAKAASWRAGTFERMTAPEMVEIEVDDLTQLADVFDSYEKNGAGPDIVLVDNFSLQDLRAAVGMRDKADCPIELEASGNVTIDTIAQIAATGVDRISSGALTHQATSLDLGFDWFDANAS